MSPVSLICSLPVCAQPTAKGCGFSGIPIAILSPSSKDPSPSCGTMTPGSIRSAPLATMAGLTSECVRSAGSSRGNFHKVYTVG